MPEDLCVEIANDMLVIKGERRKVKEEDTWTVHRRERNYGNVRRSIPIPKGADQARASVKFERGVLVVSFPRLAGQTSSGRKLAITTA